MKRLSRTVSLLAMLMTISHSTTFVPANDPNIQYFGRWDMSDPLHPKFSWPGVYLYAEFTGTTIGIRIADGINYYNVYIDGKLLTVFHGTRSGETDYILADTLENARHTFLLSRRNITFDPMFVFSGILLADSAALLEPAPKPARKIEFIGDSFTASESNEATEQSLEWEARFPVTNIDKGFAALIAKHFNAEYTTTCRSGSGMVCDWQGNVNGSIPVRFDRTLMEVSEPKWDFKHWVPDVVVICLGLNDHSGLKDKNGNVSKKNSILFRKKYRDFLKTIRTVYPNVKIVAVAAFPEWIQKNVKQVVNEERKKGKKDIYFSRFDEFPGGYVANGHPTVGTHKQMAEQILKDMEKFNLFALSKQ